jgi:hypothetical protein
VAVKLEGSTGVAGAAPPVVVVVAGIDVSPPPVDKVGSEFTGAVGDVAPDDDAAAGVTEKALKV